MTAHLFATLIDKGLTLVAGVILTLVGHRVIGKRPGVSLAADAWHAKVDPLFKIGGPILALYGLVMCAIVLMSEHPAFKTLENQAWIRQVTSDGVCSAEFPMQPTHEMKQADNVTMDCQTLYIKPIDAYYTLTFSDLPPQLPESSDQELLDTVQTSFVSTKLPNGASFQLLEGRDIKKAGKSGRMLKCRVPNQETMIRLEVFISERRVYRALTSYKPGKQLDQAAERFLASFRFEQ